MLDLDRQDPSCFQAICTLLLCHPGTQEERYAVADEFDSTFGCGHEDLGVSSLRMLGRIYRLAAVLAIGAAYHDMLLMATAFGYPYSFAARSDPPEIPWTDIAAVYGAWARRSCRLTTCADNARDAWVAEDLRRRGDLYAAIADTLRAALAPRLAREGRKLAAEVRVADRLIPDEAMKRAAGAHPAIDTLPATVSAVQTTPDGHIHLTCIIPVGAASVRVDYTFAPEHVFRLAVPRATVSSQG